MKRQFYTRLIACFIIILVLSACSSDDDSFNDPNVRVEITSLGSDFDGDIIGQGGSLRKTYEWNNPLNTADFNMDITSTPGSSFRLTLKDANGMEVLEETIIAGEDEDSRSGVSSSGQSGIWQIIIVLSNFNGDGSFSISPGN